MKLTIWLPGYLTPSLNETQYAHWSTVRKHKKRAATALLCALNDAGRVYLTETTLSEAQKVFLIASATRALYVATQKQIYSLKSRKPKSPRKTSAHASKLNIHD